MTDIVSSLFNIAPHLRSGAIQGPNYVLVRCPYHSGGTERTPSMGISTEKPVFNCLACGTSGHISKLFRSFGLSKDDVQVLLDSAGMGSRYEKKQGKVAAAIVKGRNPYRGEYVLDEDFLDAYRQAPVALLDAGFVKKTLRHFEVGVDTQNFRITYPLRNIYGELVGISGRAMLQDQEPRYKLYRHELRTRPDLRVPEDYSMESVKEALLWHAHIVRPLLFHEDEILVITEGFKACMWVWQSGYQHVVALVGAYLSELHANLLATDVRRVVLFLDNNAAGWKGTLHANRRLNERGVAVRIATYPDDREQPDNLNPEETIDAVVNAQTFDTWRKTDEHVRQAPHRGIRSS